jgi:DNA-binding winged helix-turn-helix (wHTH) protein
MRPKLPEKDSLDHQEWTDIIPATALTRGADVIRSTLGILSIDASLLFARRGDIELKFSRSERALLRTFLQNIRKVLTRDQLLDAVFGSGAAASDCNIDYLINKLRTKLGDSAKTPSLIGTQYGEGYIWLADPDEQGRCADALLVIGPVYGLKHLANALDARAFLKRLHRRTQMIVLPVRRSVELKTSTASSRVAILPIFARSRPSRIPT